MAYSDYGGYAYRNGKRVVERSDCQITEKGDIYSSPGLWPGFARLIQGQSKEEVEKTLDYPNGHVILGDGPVFLCLYKQSSFYLYRGFELVSYENWVKNFNDFPKYDGNPDSIDIFQVIEKHMEIEGELEGVKIDLHLEETDNFYQYASLTQPDGTIWTGFSGYGVGFGLEDGSHGYSTDSRIHRLEKLWPPIQ